MLLLFDFYLKDLYVLCLCYFITWALVDLLTFSLYSFYLEWVFIFIKFYFTSVILIKWNLLIDLLTLKLPHISGIAQLCFNMLFFRCVARFFFPFYLKYHYVNRYDESIFIHSLLIVKTWPIKYPKFIRWVKEVFNFFFLDKVLLCNSG